MNRADFLNEIQKNEIWDFIIIGGGATGIGIAVDASSRGYKTLLVEQSDFTKSTSSKSTKLLHGGVRYLEKGNLALVFEALRERGIILKNAPHLSKNISFIIPVFSFWEKLKYILGLKLYDWLSGSLSLGNSIGLSKTGTLEKYPFLKKNKLYGGVLYHDGQFDDSRLAINLLQTAVKYKACVLNYMRVVGIIKNNEQKICGVKVIDQENQKKYQLKGRYIINATGVFSDSILQMDDFKATHTISPSQGIHLVFDQSIISSTYALMIPKTSDGRVLFILPWHQKILVGTTDTPVSNISLDPIALEKEVQFILEAMQNYIKHSPTKKDILSVFVGLRPLAYQQTANTKEISRSHKITISKSGLVSIIGGKWTTYRQMAENLINKIEKTQKLPRRACITKTLKIQGSELILPQTDSLYYYGSDAKEIKKLFGSDDYLISDKLKLWKSQIIWAVRYEMALNIEDVLSRRVRATFLDVRESLIIAPKIAQIMAKELQKTEDWVSKQIIDYQSFCQSFLL